SAFNGTKAGAAIIGPRDCCASAGIGSAASNETDPPTARTADNLEIRTRAPNKPAVFRALMGLPSHLHPRAVNSTPSKEIELPDSVIFGPQSLPQNTANRGVCGPKYEAIGSDNRLLPPATVPHPRRKYEFRKPNMRIVALDLRDAG